MNTCETCRHWGKRAKQEEGVRDCAAVPMLWDAFDWSENYEQRVLRPEFAGRKAFAQDGSDYSARLYTRPDFACNQWEAKE